MEEERKATKANCRGKAVAHHLPWADQCSHSCQREGSLPPSDYPPFTSLSTAFGDSDSLQADYLYLHATVLHRKTSVLQLAFSSVNTLHCPPILSWLPSASFKNDVLLYKSDSTVRHRATETRERHLLTTSLQPHKMSLVDVDL